MHGLIGVCVVLVSLPALYRIDLKKKGERDSSDDFRELERCSEMHRV